MDKSLITIIVQIIGVVLTIATFIIVSKRNYKADTVKDVQERQDLKDRVINLETSDSNQSENIKSSEQHMQDVEKTLVQIQSQMDQITQTLSGLAVTVKELTDKVHSLEITIAANIQDRKEGVRNA